MKTIRIVLALLITASFISCEQSNKKETDSKHEETKSEEATEHHVAETVLSLDNGKLWEANVETTNGIENMINLMASFSDKENVESYTTLKEGLEKEFGEIITNCSMTGEPHNQLHNYLVPIVETFKGLASDDLAICKENFENLNKHLSKYDAYFK